MEQTAFMAKMKIYEAYKSENINEEQANYFINLIEEGLIRKEIIQKYTSNTAHDAIIEIYNSCGDIAKSKGFGKYPIVATLKDGTKVSPSNTEYYNTDEYKSINALYNLKTFAIYVSRTTAVYNHKSNMLEDIINERIDFPIEDLEFAKGKNLLEEKFILLDYLKTHMENNSKYQKAFNDLNKDIQFSCKNA